MIPSTLTLYERSKPKKAKTNYYSIIGYQRKVWIVNGIATQKGAQLLEPTSSKTFTLFISNNFIFGYNDFCRN